jgi:CheY-like chemotaxis protein/HPt (histidine-containing phosphotransfer) domain-containing protein
MYQAIALCLAGLVVCGFAAGLLRWFGPGVMGLPAAAQLQAMREDLRRATDCMAEAQALAAEFARQADRVAESEARFRLFAGSGHGGAGPRPLRVLVVDDVEANRDIAAAFIRSAGHEVVCVSGGQEAVAAVADNAFDLIMMDLRMPGIDGLEAARRIRAMDGPLGRVPIVALTAEVFADQVEACRNAGMDSHLAKPFTPEALLATLTRGVAAAEPQAPGARAFGTMPGIAGLEQDPPVLDLAMLQRTAASLEPKTAVMHLRTVARQGEALLRALRSPDALMGSGSALAESAHAVAGSAGLFGFERLAVVARHFERAVQTDSPALLSLADDLSVALEASLQQMQTQTCVALAA